MKVRGELASVFYWNGFYYGIKKYKKSSRYYKSKNVRFDDTCGVTEEINEEEYHQNSVEYIKIFKTID